MPLVEYSDSESSGSSGAEGNGTKKQCQQGVKRKRTPSPGSSLPPLPDTFHDLYASTSRISNQDDPSLHGGRQRVTPHIEGNWPTHIYIEWYPSTENTKRLDDLLANMREDSSLEALQVHSLLKSDLGAELPLHISLSRPIALRAEQRRPFTDSLINAVSKSSICPFEVAVAGLDWVANYEQTRWFLVMRLEKAPRDSLNQLLRISNETVQVFGQPPLYADSQIRPQVHDTRQQKKRSIGRSQTTSVSASQEYPAHVAALNHMDASDSFHISVGWVLTAPSEALVEKLNQTRHDLQLVKIDVHTVKLKIGNGITAVSLASKIDSSNKIIEK
ncbi:hypothetical protein N7G274_005925 [Stereocaulon virgatum]|uniref:U6 snRNA phosphodiesterase n=1 Tax=Stereocaulon virgatum TaxID=373712 RepID=A0ABR4ADR9_9LECA